MISVVAFVVWFYVAPICAVLFLRSDLLIGGILSVPWFWSAWSAAEHDDPIGSLAMFVVGAALLWMGFDIHWFREDLAWRPSR